MMKMKKNFWIFMAASLFAGFAFSSCSDSDNDDDSTTYKGAAKAYILNEGGYQSNNASISLYSPDTKGNATDLFKKVNGRYLGDTGQDLIRSGYSLYVSVYGSGYVARLDTTGLVMNTANITSPRYLAVQGDYLYVSAYASPKGYVYKLNASTLQKVDSVTVGMNPEHVAIYDNRLVVANSGWGADSTLSVINLSTFKVDKTVVVSKNPDKVAVCGGSVFVISNNDFVNLKLEEVSMSDYKVTYIGNAVMMAPYNDKLYLANSVTNWSTHVTANSFYVYDPSNATLGTISFLRDEPAKLLSTGISMFEINPVNGDIYLGTSDYASNGDVYRFSWDGKLLDTFDAGGITPNNAVFLP